MTAKQLAPQAPVPIAGIAHDDVRRQISNVYTGGTRVGGGI